MTNTARLNLPLVAAAQAQKHVTVNEALSRLDAVVQLSVKSRVETVPPTLVVENDVFLVPATGGVNAWSGHANQLAYYINGGWDFVDPLPGWKTFVADEGVHLTFDGADWSENVLAMTPFRAAMRAEVEEFDFEIPAGASALTPFVLPGSSSVFGITGVVVSEITGTLMDWSLGVSTSSNRYGSSLGLGEGSWVQGLTGQPVTYYSAEQLVLTANGGDFAGGTVRLAVHRLRFDIPNQS